MISPHVKFTRAIMTTLCFNRKTVLKDQSQRESFAKRFVREAETLKNHMAKYPSYSHMALNVS